jgi:hypothetical protein
MSKPRATDPSTGGSHEPVAADARGAAAGVARTKADSTRRRAVVMVIVATVRPIRRALRACA